MSFDKITVVINTFHSEDQINQCLDTVPSDLEVIVVENSNNLNFKNKIEKNYNNTRCYLTGKNLGYAKGNNYGLAKVKTQFALILNPDAKLKKDAIKNFLISSEKIKDFAIIGPAKQDEFQKNNERVIEENLLLVDNLKGFAMFLNLDELREIGFFDENFFIYLEETDLCKRIRKKNKKIYLDKNIHIEHIGGSSHNENINFEMELSRNWHWMWSKFYFNKKHYGYLVAFFKVFRNLISAKVKFFYYLITLNTFKRKIYQMRLLGLISSMIGKNSYYRPNF